jgi:hypothetical protein
VTEGFLYCAFAATAARTKTAAVAKRRIGSGSS